MSKAAIFDIPFAKSKFHSTQSNYVISIIPTLLIPELKPLLKPLKMVNQGLLLMQILFELHFVFLDQKSIQILLLNKDASPFMQH